MGMFTGGTPFPSIGGDGGGGGGLGSLASTALSFIPGGNLIGALGGLFGAGASHKILDSGIDDIKNLPGMQGAQGLAGNFGNVDAQGNFQMDQGLAAMQSALGAGAAGQLGGGVGFNQGNFQNAFQNADVTGAVNQANQAFGTQQGANQFGGLQGLFNQQQGLGNQFANMTAQGPQDFSGGMQGQQFGMGLQNQLAAMDQSGLQNQELNTMRTAAQPAMDRQFNQLQNRLFATGQMGSTGGGQQLEGLFNSFGQQDLGFQQEAFNRASQQQNFLGNLGSQQIGQGAGLMGQNLGQFNQGAQLANMFQQGAAGLQGQQFGQELGANQFNTSQGMNRVAQALGLVGQGSDMFNQSFGQGLGAAAGQLGFGEFGLDAARSPFELQAGLLSGGGQHAEALGALASEKAAGAGGFLSGFSDRRLKDNITRIGSWGDLSWYEWDWNDKAKEVGADKEPSYGVIAQEVAELYPQAVGTKDGYLTVHYGVLTNGI